MPSHHLLQHPWLTALALLLLLVPVRCPALTAEESAQSDQWEELIHVATRARKGGDFTAAFVYLGQAKEMARGFGPKDLHGARLVMETADTYRLGKRWDLAVETMQEAITLAEGIVGPDDPQLGIFLENLANYYTYYDVRKVDLDKAEGLLLRILRIEQHHDPGSIEVARRAHNLGSLYQRMARWDAAERCFSLSLTVAEQLTKAGTISVTEGSSYLLEAAAFAQARGQYSQAELLAKKALDMREGVSGAPQTEQLDPRCEVAMCYDQLGAVYLAWDKPGSAEDAYAKALAIGDKLQGDERPDQGQRHAGLADALRRQNRYADAEPHYQKALRILRGLSGTEAPELAPVLEGYALLLAATDRHPEADSMIEQAKAIRAGSAPAAASE